MIKDFRCVSLLIVLTLLFAFALAPVVFGAEADAEAAIVSARHQLVVYFQSAAAAEANGANITHLTQVLNDAGALLSDAELAFANGDFDLAESLALDSQVGLANFNYEVNSIMTTAADSANRDFMFNVVGSIVAVIIVVSLGVFAWFFVTKRYARRGEGELSWRQID